MNKFIYAFNEEDKHELLNRGLVFLSEGIIDNKTVYIFLNSTKVKFSNEDKRKFMFSNKLFF
ncbi:MAG: hypothetical protein ACLR4X_11735 [Clostridia bacterium]|jgi:hypothetical protein|nr:MAG TPA: hypothetical protein [Caudoviricetes sp.]DAI47187.1 MAG TPA: hypothetical protein [Caudoviricetes sp.]DAI89348.1 MAG TPA: hypothetical protein [Caudoviricetes sp.]DAJ41476.1 MAG TPA: hypothetical protein [Caudoviricetes sp.]DAJ62614.1 MAG TPA: hypothetical protein [Caudoviricetes sp.]